jgi:sulfite reductase (ferredoxin)
MSTTPATPPSRDQGSEERAPQGRQEPLNAWDEVREFARLGRDSVPAEWATLLPLVGVYTQGDGGVIGGANGEGKAT